MNHYNDIVTRVIDKWDPEYLLSGGAPEDEYEPEIKEIVEYVDKVKTKEELALVIKKVFERFFGVEYDANVCLEVASEIWGKLK